MIDIESFLMPESSHQSLHQNRLEINVSFNFPAIYESFNMNTATTSARNWREKTFMGIEYGTILMIFLTIMRFVEAIVQILVRSWRGKTFMGIGFETILMIFSAIKRILEAIDKF